jgi:hypothetical protein
MAHERLDRSLPRPVRARLLAVQLGRSFSEVISALYRLGDDVEAVVRHFNAQDVEEVRRRRRRDETVEPESEPPAPILTCKSESESIIVDTPPNNGAVIDEAVARGVLAPAVVGTARGVRTVYASPGFAKFLSAACGEEWERDDFCY